jgi:hypothetical protein
VLWVAFFRLAREVMDWYPGHYFVLILSIQCKVGMGNSGSRGIPTVEDLSRGE